MTVPGPGDVAPLRVLPYGTDAVLVEADRAELVLPLAAAAQALPGVREVVPGARTVLLVLDRAARAADVVRAVDGLDLSPRRRRAGNEVVIDVRYDGPDLADTAGMLGVTIDTLVERHSSASYVVAFCGFVPGFAYLTGLPAGLHAPRLADPRTRVPSGSVGIAGEFTGIYPRASPGGWRLLGRTDARLWDVERTPPALLVPDTPVRFRPVR